MNAKALRFLLIVVLAWAVVRAIWLWPRAPSARAAPTPRWAAPLPPVAAPRQVRRTGLRVPMQILPMSQAAQSSLDQPTTRLTGVANPAAAEISPARSPPASDEADLMTSPSKQPHLSISAWALVRPSGGAAGLAPGGQLGASQAGVRATLPISRHLAVAARLSAPIAAPHGKEAALALDWCLPPRLPVTLSIERRIGLDRGGRDAWAVGVFGGVSDFRLTGRMTVDIYAQAGLVGARRRDGYADGAIRILHPLGRHGFAGAGLWAAAQPGVARLDVGPMLGVRVGRARLSMEWRARIAGAAHPASGPALSLGADF